MNWALRVVVLVGFWPAATLVGAAETFTVYVSNLCPDANPDGSRAKPYASIAQALSRINNAVNQIRDNAVVLLPTDPARPYDATSIGTPGKEVRIVSEGGPEITSCRKLTISSGNAAQ